MENLPDVAALSRLYLFRSVPPRDLAELCSLAPPVRYEAAKVLFRQGDPADVGLLLVEGRLVASVRVGDVIRQVGDVRPGEIAGETALFNPNGRRSATLVAAQLSTAIKLSWYMLEKAPQNQAILALEQHLLGALVRRIRKTNQAIQAEWHHLAGSTPTAPAPSEPSVARRGLLQRLCALFEDNG